MGHFIGFALLVIFIFVGLCVAGVFTRVCYAITDKIAEAPALDFFVSLFTWIPWGFGFWANGWLGLLAAVVAELIFLHVFCLVHRAVYGKKGRTLTDAQGRLLGPLRNQLCLLVQTPAIFAFVGIRLTELLLYPAIAAIGKLPTYKQSEWVNLSRHKFSGLIGYDLLWCWYCDWMTGLWSLGSEMLRNIESFWCPIQFQSPIKNKNASIDFPDVAKWAPADSDIEEAVKRFEQHYEPGKPHSWWGHPDRKKSE